MPKVLIYIPKELLPAWKKLKNKSFWVQSHLKLLKEKESK